MTPGQSKARLHARKPARAAGRTARHGCNSAAAANQGALDKLSPAKCRVQPGGAVDRAAAVVHFAAEDAGMPADRTAAPRRQLLRQHSSMCDLLAGARPAVSGDEMPHETAHR